MKIKRFIAPDMRQTIRQVRETLGADAVILSNKRVEGGIEVVAAIDYDESLFDETNDQLPTGTEETLDREEIWNDVRFGRNIPKPEPIPKSIKASGKSKPASKVPLETEHFPAVDFYQDAGAGLEIPDPAMRQVQTELKSLRGLLVNQLSGIAWGQETQYHPLRARLLQRLIALGLSPVLAKDIASKVNEQDDFEHNWRMALGELAHRVTVSDDDILNQGGVIALVGATGVGKTTTIAKLAARYILRHGPKRVGLITTDNYRVAAHEQLRSYARIMGAPMRVATDVESLRDALMHFRDKDLVLIDTAGMGQRDMRLNEQFAMLAAAGREIKSYLVMATNTQRGVLQESVKAFKQVKLSGTILSKVDETISLGGALSIAIEHDLPLAYLSDGQQVPEDLHPARAHTLISRAVTIMQQVGVGTRDDNLLTTIGGMAAHAHV